MSSLKKELDTLLSNRENVSSVLFDTLLIVKSRIIKFGRLPHSTSVQLIENEN